MTKDEYLKAAHTRMLLIWRNKSYACGGYYNPLGNHCCDMEFTTEQILTELNTREHVPTKVEAKIIRQNKAKQRI
ncbi:MAG: hypothetical protein COA84_13645 [Robiginitomaculum sp.]|nr:MAG: hypothetical protein COA84_13645 [Robiginitomaculum sp.]